MLKQQPEIRVRIRKTNQIIIEQSNDAILQQLQVKLLHEEYSENVLQQDARYRRYANNLEQSVVKKVLHLREDSALGRFARRLWVQGPIPAS